MSDPERDERQRALDHLDFIESESNRRVWNPIIVGITMAVVLILLAIADGLS